MNLTTSIPVLRKQHSDLLRLSRGITMYLDEKKLVGEAEGIRSSLTEFARLLVWHLDLEDGILYPDLLRHKNSEIKKTAKAYMEEMGDLKKVFDDYNRKWMDFNIIRNKAGDFIVETMAIFDALEARIKKENTVLFVMIESLGKN